MMDIDVTDAPELSVGGGGTQSVPSRNSVMMVEEAIAGDTPRLGCPCDWGPARVTARDNSFGSPGVGGKLSPSRITAIDVTDAPALSGGGPPSVPSRISVVLVEEAKAGGTPRSACQRNYQDIRSLAGVAKPAGVTVYDDRLGSPCVGGTLSSSDIAGMSFPVGPVDPAQLARVLQGALLSPFFSDPADPAGCAGGPVGPYGTLSPSDSDPAGPAGFAREMG